MLQWGHLPFTLRYSRRCTRWALPSQCGHCKVASVDPIALLQTMQRCCRPLVDGGKGVSEDSSMSSWGSRSVLHCGHLPLTFKYSRKWMRWACPRHWGQLRVESRGTMEFWQTIQTGWGVPQWGQTVVSARMVASHSGHIANWISPY